MPAARVSPATNALSNQLIRSTQRTRIDERRRLPFHITNDSIESEGSDHICDSVNSLATYSKSSFENSDLTPYEKVMQNFNDEKWQREIMLGRRIGFYRFRGDIGSGNFSQVKLAMHCLTKEKVAIKILDKGKLDAKTLKMLMREIASMEQLHHPNLIKIFEVIETFSKFHLIMEYAPCGELFHKINTQGKMSEEEAKPLFVQIVSAIDHMHQHNIIHRDIKAENVFFADMKTVKVGDFGFSTNVLAKNQLLDTFCGSPPYAAPELFCDESYVGPYVDLWALGILLYFMVTSKMPFKAQNISNLKRLIIEGNFEIPSYLSEDCIEVIKGLLKQTPETRMNLGDLMKTKWMKGQNFPQSLPKYKSQSPTDTFCDNSISLSNDDELEAHKIMKELGIDDSMIEENLEKGLRNNVTGIYRIILHRLINSKYFKGKCSLENTDTNNCNDNNNIKSLGAVDSKVDTKKNGLIKLHRSRSYKNSFEKSSIGNSKNSWKDKIEKKLNSVKLKKSKTCLIL